MYEPKFLNIIWKPYLLNKIWKCKNQSSKNISLLLTLLEMIICLLIDSVVQFFFFWSFFFLGSWRGCMDPGFSRAFPLDWWYSFFYLVKILFLEKNLESPFILVFFKGKQNINKTLCDFLFGKDMSTKIEFRFGDQVTY